MGTQLSSPSQQRRQSRQISAQVYWGQTALWIKMALGMEVGLGPGDIVLDGDPSPLTKRGHSHPILGQFLLWPNGWMYQDTTWYGGRPLPRRHCVRWGPSSPPLKGHSPQFSVHGRFGQTARWTKMPLGMEVGLDPGVFVLDGDPAPPRKGHSSPLSLFGPCLLWPRSPIAATAELL